MAAPCFARCCFTCEGASPDVARRLSSSLNKRKAPCKPRQRCICIRESAAYLALYPCLVRELKARFNLDADSDTAEQFAASRQRVLA